MRRYSRLITVQEKKHRRQAFIWIFLTFALLVVLVVWGIPTLANLSSLLYDIKGGQKTENVDKLSPAPPLFTSSISATNIAVFTLTGSGEPKSKLIIFHNGKQEEIDINEDGSFSHDATLVEGENTFSGRVRDGSGNESQNSREYSVKYDAVAPELEIIYPVDAQTFQGTTEQNLTIKLKTNEEAEITINGRVVTSLGENEYSFQTKLLEGQNTFNIKTKDEAGNETEKNISLTYFP